MYAYSIKANVEVESNKIFESIKDNEDNFAQLLRADTAVQSRFLEEFEQQPLVDAAQARLLVINAKNMVVYDSTDELMWKELDIELVRRALLSGKPVYEDYTLEGDVHILYAVTPLKTSDGIQGAILHSENISPLFKKVDLIAKRLYKFGLGFIIISTILVYFGVRQLYRPLNDLSEGVEQMIRGHYEYRIELTDINDEVKKIAASFNSMAERLNEIDMHQSELISNVSHELKTPIASMKIVTQSLVEAKDSVDKDVIFDFLNDINMEANRLSEIIEDLLLVAKLERMDMKLQLELRPIDKPLLESLRILAPLAAEKNITIKQNFLAKPTVEFDYNKMKQVFINILSNAVKYSEGGGSITITLQESSQGIEISIKDTGIGIPEKDLPYVFDRFYRVDKHRARKEGGTGLGLNIVKQIVNLHRGTITVESEVDVGTTFTIRLPKRYTIS